MKRLISIFVILITGCSGFRDQTIVEQNDFDRFSKFVKEDMEISNCYPNIIKTKDSTFYFEILVLSHKDTFKSRQVLIIQETPKGLIFRTKCDSAILNPKFGIDPFINIYADTSGFTIIHAGGDDNWEMKTSFQYKPELNDWFLTGINSKNEVVYNGCDTTAMFGPLLYVSELKEKDFKVIKFSDYTVSTPLLLSAE